MKTEQIQLQAELLSRQALDQGLGAVVILGDLEAVGMVCNLNIEGSCVHIDSRAMRLVFEPELEARIAEGDLLAIAARDALATRSVGYLLAMEAMTKQAAASLERIGAVLRRYQGAKLNGKERA